MPQTTLGARQRAVSQQRCMLGDRLTVTTATSMTASQKEGGKPYRKTGVFSKPSRLHAASSTRHARSPMTLNPTKCSMHNDDKELPTADRAPRTDSDWEVLRHTRGAPARERCSGTREVLRHKRGAPAREAVLRHERGASAQERRSGARSGAPESGTTCDSAQERHRATRQQHDHGRLRTHNARDWDTRLRVSSGRLPVSSTPRRHTASQRSSPPTHGLEDEAAKGEAIVRVWGCGLHKALGLRIPAPRLGAHTGIYEGHGSPGVGGANSSSLLFVY